MPTVAQVNLLFDPARHDYSADGRTLPYITGILRYVGLYSDYSFSEDVHRFRGTTVHHGCARLDSGGYAELEDPSKGQTWLRMSEEERKQVLEAAHDIEHGYWPAFEDAKRKLGFRGLIWEVPMIDPVLGFGGCFDTIVECDGLELWDIKSGDLPVMVPAQLGGYDLLRQRGKVCAGVSPDIADWLEIHRGTPLKRRALLLKKDGTWKLYSETPKGRSYDDPYWTTLFRSALNVYHARMEYGLTGVGYAQHT